MALDLSNIVVPYKEFYGRNTEQMPQLIEEGRVPISVQGVLQQRLHSGKPDWKDNYFDTGDALAYHPDGKFKVVPDAQILRDMTESSGLRSGALELGDGVYESLEGQEFTRKDAEKWVERELTSQEAKSNPLWRALARDQDLLNEYVDAMFPEMKERFDYDANMGIYLSSGDRTVPTARAALVGRLEGRSRLYGRDGLDFGVGRLVGVAPEALDSPDK